MTSALTGTALLAGTTLPAFLLASWAATHRRSRDRPSPGHLPGKRNR
ncbi:DUF6256 family protein [Streptomyces sp. QH1-20]